jgi:starvation-inducible DNA-binding protein
MKTTNAPESKTLAKAPAKTPSDLDRKGVAVISRHQRLKDNNEEFVLPRDMLAELSDDNQQLTRFMRAAHGVCDQYNDVATASLVEVWIDQSERRTWFLSQIVADQTAEDTR